MSKIIISTGNKNEDISTSFEIRVRKKDTIWVERYLSGRKREQSASIQNLCPGGRNEHFQCILQGV